MRQGMRRREFLKNTVMTGAAVSLAGRTVRAEQDKPALKRRGSPSSASTTATLQLSLDVSGQLVYAMRRPSGDQAGS